MNKHMELVKKWLDDPSSVTKEELKANTDSASDAYVEASAIETPAAYANAVYAAAAYAACADAHEHYVKKYEELLEEKSNG